MSLRRAVHSLLTWRFSPRATPRTALRDLSIGDGLRRRVVVFAAAALVGGAGTLGVQYFKKGTDGDESASSKKPSEEDLKARFEDWAKKYNRTYLDQEEKAMRFQVFKDTIEWIESQPPALRDMLRPLNCFADLKSEEIHPRSCIVEIDDPRTREYNKKLNEWLARNDKGEEFFWPPMKQDDKQTTHISA